MISLSCRYSITVVPSIMQAQAIKPQVIYGSQEIKTNLISVVARYNCRPKPSNCANFAKGRNGMHHISEVRQTSARKSNSKFNSSTFLGTCYQRKILSPVSRHAYYTYYPNPSKPLLCEVCSPPQVMGRSLLRSLAVVSFLQKKVVLHRA
jgi:hypothetical protein